MEKSSFNRSLDEAETTIFQPVGKRLKKVLILFGTRPEIIKLAPIVHELKNKFFQTIVVSSSQHRELLQPFLKMLGVEVDYDLRAMRKNQTPTEVAARVMQKLDAILAAEQPDLILTQGDTMTALAGSLAGFNRKIPVGHVEAGLRSGNSHSPFPEEMNRRLISQVADFHFAATEENRLNLLKENVADEKVFVTGNPVVDALKSILKYSQPGARIAELLESTRGKKRLLLTTHRRESFGAAMSDNLNVLREFVEKHADVCLFFPVHPNPNVRTVTSEILAGCKRVYLLEPLDYTDFVALMKNSWLIVSDSGGVQEEAPSLGKPLLILRENTERPEAVDSGVAKLVGGAASELKSLLETNYTDESWIKSVKKIANPFGDGQAAKRIVKIIHEKLSEKSAVK